MLSPVLALCLPPWCPAAKALPVRLPPAHGKSIFWAQLLDRIDADLARTPAARLDIYRRSLADFRVYLLTGEMPGER